MSVVIIITLSSGGGAAAAHAPAGWVAAAVADPLVDDVDIQVTDRSGRARELAQAAVKRGVGRVVAWGGDGTVNEIASALAFGAVPLGLVPAGSGNGLARALRVPADPVRALKAALLVKPRSIDMGELDGHLFVNLAGIGLDAYVAARFNDPTNRRRGPRMYVELTARALLHYRCQEYTIVANGERRAVCALFIVAANGAEFGNRILIAPGARVDDGALDLVVVEERSRFGTICRVPWLVARSIDRVSVWSSQRVTDATIESDSPMPYHVDGEPMVGGSSLRIRTHPGALSVCA